MWIKAHASLTRHPKTKRLGRTLGISVPEAIGHLMMLWLWAMDYAQDGDLSCFEPEDIADAAGWDGDPDQLIDALLSCSPRGHGFLDRTEDGGLVLHEWDEHCGDEFERRRKDAERKRTARQKDIQRTHDEETMDATRPSDGHPTDIQRTSDGHPTPVRRERRGEERRRDIPPLPPQGGGGGDGGGDAPRSEPEHGPPPAVPVEAFGEGFEAAAIAGCTLSQVIEAWNGELGPLGFPRVAKGTPARERAFRARVAERVERRDLTWWRERIAQLAASPFMCQSAREKAGWLGLDWLLNEHNLVKVVEGKYDGERIPRARDRPPETYEEAVARYRGEGSVVDAEFGEVMTCSERTSLVSSSSWPVPLT